MERTSKKPGRAWIYLFFPFIASLACSISNPPAIPLPSDEDKFATAVAATVQSPSDNQTSPSDSRPRSLYFLGNIVDPTYQVWRIDPLNFNLQQITFETVSVTEYSVSPTDGRVAFVTKNQIFIAGPDGSNPKMIVDGSPVDDASDRYHFQRKISGLAWSPDGSLIAYGQDGINLYQVGAAQTHKIIPNQININEDGKLIPEKLYFPDEFSPSGARLLVNVGYSEGATLAALEISTGKLVTFGSGVVCCQPAWTPDSRAVLVASKEFGLVEPGLWRYDAATGEETIILPSISSEGAYNFVGFPIQLPSGNLQYLYGSTTIFPESAVPLTLVQSDADGITNRAPLRPEVINALEMLWSPQGEAAVIIQYPLGDLTWPPTGPVLMIDIAGSQIRPLAANGYNIQWGP